MSERETLDRDNIQDGSLELSPSQPAERDAEALTEELEKAREALREAEAALASEQAAVNSFRMHCRLKLDAWIETLTDLQQQRQSLITRLHLLRQAGERGVEFSDGDSFWDTEEILASLDSESGENEPEEELLLPTDTPRDKEAEKRFYRKLVRKFHPDLGVTAVEIAYRTEMMTAINIAHEQDDVQALYDLAGELDPLEVAGIAAIQSKEMRILQKQLLQCRRRQRRAWRRLESLRAENTARLWQKARLLDESDTDWWEVVRREIERHIERLEGEVAKLRESINRLEEQTRPDSEGQN